MGIGGKKRMQATTKGPAKRVEKQILKQSFPMRRKEKPMVEQNSVNDKKASNNQRQETERKRETR